MTHKTKVRRIGNSLGVILPKEALAHLKVEEGQEIYLTKTADGGFRLEAADTEFVKTMKVFEDINRRYRNTLRELAK